MCQIIEIHNNALRAKLLIVFGSAMWRICSFLIISTWTDLLFSIWLLKCFIKNIEGWIKENNSVSISTLDACIPSEIALFCQSIIKTIMKCTTRLQLWPYNNTNTKKKQILIASRKFDCHCREYPPEFPTPRDQHQAKQKEFHKQRLSASPETISVYMSFCCSCKFCHCKEDESLQLWSHFHVNNQQQWFATNNTVEIDLVQILSKTFFAIASKGLDYTADCSAFLKPS